MNICIFGDSTAWGAWDAEKGGWVNRLQLYFNALGGDDTPMIYNLSISGGTTDTILRRFESEAKIRKVDALIFQSGGNDAYLQRRGGQNQIPPDVFDKNVSEIIARAKPLTEKIMFIGFKNVDEGKTTPVSWSDIYYHNDQIQKYDKIMERVCKDTGVPYLDIFGLFDTVDFEDGLHPNSQGHEKLFVRVKGFLLEQKWITA